MTPLIAITCSTVRPDLDTAQRQAVNASYIAWVERAGGAPLLLPNVSPDLVNALLDRVDGLLLAGGEDIQPLLYGEEPSKHLGRLDVPRDRFELPLARAALARDLPVLGICRGLQTLNVAAGGTLVQDLVHDPTATVQHRMETAGGATVHHTISVREGSLLHQVLGADSLGVNSYHHQAVDQLGRGLVASAHAADGTVEGLEGEDSQFVLGVQWHPEVMGPDDAASQALFEAFVNACR